MSAGVQSTAERRALDDAADWLDAFGIDADRIERVCVDHWGERRAVRLTGGVVIQVQE